MSDPRLRPGSRACRCSVCGEYFGGERAFDEHRVGPMSDRRSRLVGLLAATRASLGGRLMKRAGQKAQSRRGGRLRDGTKDAVGQQRGHSTSFALSSTSYGRILAAGGERDAGHPR